MDRWSYQDAQAFALSWGGVYFLIMFAVALAYAMWPSNGGASKKPRIFRSRTMETFDGRRQETRSTKSPAPKRPATSGTVLRN